MKISLNCLYPKVKTERYLRINKKIKNFTFNSQIDIQNVVFPSTSGNKWETFFQSINLLNKIVSVVKDMFKKPKEWSLKEARINLARKSYRNKSEFTSRRLVAASVLCWMQKLITARDIWIELHRKLFCTWETFFFKRIKE